MTVFLKRDRSLRLITTLPEQNTCRVCAGGVWYQCSLVSPTCFHSFRAGSGGKFEPEGSVEPDEEMCCVFPATCWLAVCLLGLVVGVLLFIWSCLSLTDFGGRIKDFNFKKKKSYHHNNKNWYRDVGWKAHQLMFSVLRKTQTVWLMLTLIMSWIHRFRRSCRCLALAEILLYTYQ